MYLIAPKIVQVLRSFKFWIFLLIFYFLFSSSIYAVGSLVKHSHFETFGDLAVFNQGIWQYSKFEWPFITLHLNRPFLGDHFHPIVAILAPLYWIYSSEKVLLFSQPFIILSAVFPLFLLGVRLTKSLFFSFCITVAYSLYIPLQYAIFYDFHEIIFLPPLFAWAYYFYTLNKKYLVSIFFILLLLTKEEVGFFVATFALFIAFTRVGWRRFGIFWAGFGFAYSIFIMYFFIPKVGGSNIYFDYGQSGQTPVEVLFNMVKNPLSIPSAMFGSPIKRETLYRTFWPFAFLPLISPVSLILSAEQFISRFFDFRTVTRWTIGYHYSTPMTVIVAIGTIWSANFYSRLFKNRAIVLIALGVLILLLTRVEQINASAVLLIKTPQFWQRDAWMDTIDQAILLLPADVSVATQNNIISHVSARKNIYILDQRSKADYILVDLHEGQSSYNFFGEKKQKEIKDDVYNGIKQGKYFVIYQKAQTYLLKRV